MQERIHRYFVDCQSELIDTIARLVAVKSVKEDPLPGMPFGKGPAEALALNLKIAEEMGFAVKNYDNYVGVADLNEKETRLGILCHLDVVGEGTGWDTPPYSVVAKDGMIYGRGTSDDKGPAVASLFALRAVRDLGIPLRYNARLILGTDEESGSSDIKYYFSREKTPAYTFSPDGDFPVTNIEKGGLKPTFSKTWAVSEALPRIVSIKGGYRINVIPPEAEALVEGLPAGEIQRYCDAAAKITGAQYHLSQENGLVKIAVKGKGEHAATPEKGVNAITSLFTALVSLPLAESESFAAVKALNEMFPHGDYYGKAVGVAQSDELSGPLTLSFNIYEQSLTGFSGRFDSRTPICTTKENFADVVAARFNAHGIQMEGELTAPHCTSEDSEFVQTLLAAYEKYTGQKGYCEAIGGGTYVHNIEGGVCFGPGMPGFEPFIHGANEHTSVKDLLTAAEIYTQVIIDLCS